MEGLPLACVITVQRSVLTHRSLPSIKVHRSAMATLE
jgi:hypothetical protein